MLSVIPIFIGYQQLSAITMNERKTMHRIFACLTTLLVFAVLIPNPASAGEKETPKAFTNSAGMKLLWIPAGEFMMGSNISAAELAKLAAASTGSDMYRFCRIWPLVARLL